MYKAPVFSAKLAKVSTMNLPSYFSETVNGKLLAQAIRVYEWRLHPRRAKVKTRGEVALSTKKIYRQKHTGRARHGAKSAPIFEGGGVTHGPKGVRRTLTLARNMRIKARNVALSLKAKDKKIAVVSQLDSIKKTREANALVEKITAKLAVGRTAPKLTLGLSESNKDASLYFRNINKVNVVPYKNLNAHNVYFGGLLVIDKEVFDKKVKGKR